MFNLSTLSGINLKTDNYFQYTSNPKELFGKLFYVWRKTQVCLNLKVLAFLEMRFWAFWEGKVSEDFWGLSLLEWDKLWIKWKCLFVAFFMRLVDYGRMFIVPGVIMVKYFLIWFLFEFVNRFFLLKKRITESWRGKLESLDVRFK